MSGQLPPLDDLHNLALKNKAVLYVDDANGTGVLGVNGRGTVYDNLGSYDNLFVVGSLSKAFSCLGGFVGCSKEFQQLLKVRSNSYIFGGPVAPCYLDAICTVIDILKSPEYSLLKERLQSNLSMLVDGARPRPHRAGRIDANRFRSRWRRRGDAGGRHVIVRTRFLRAVRYFSCGPLSCWSHSSPGKR